MKYLPIRILSVVLVAGAFVLFPLASSAQQGPPPPDMTVDAATRSAVIDNLIKQLNDAYIFPETAKKMEADLRSRLSNKEYDSVTSARAFAEKLTADVQSVSKDKHLRIRYLFETIPVRKDSEEPTESQRAERRWFNQRLNYGFEKIERMQGNVGYIDLRGFNDDEAGADTVAAAMTFLENTESIIFDLRQNGGGNPAMVALISSYLFGDKPVHLNDLYWRKDNKTEEFWTKPDKAKKRFPAKDIYILTSQRTFSAGEEFTYNLKNLKRATIIGETTGGGAHPGGSERLGDHFAAFIPVGRAINPISKTNWEGTGVEPDIKVPKEQALKTAHLMALNKSLGNIKDENMKNGVKALIEQTQKELDEMKGAKTAQVK
ncbi:MAG TPA: S41 family peptidase [Pyrinomonadaceae bacterium]|nr:S41 family peptidase [Pyrinomonadaceae bacterium]